jgi:transcriptional regulator with XRE-family HTH domain
MSYTSKIVRLNADADPTLLGVQLGRLCIYRQVPVADVAQALNVTKAAVYRWFSGKRDVSKHLRERVLEYYRSALPPA